MIIKLFTELEQLSSSSSSMSSSSSSLSEFWRTWNLRIFVILSFFIQGFLIIGGALRKQRTSRALIGLLWLAYVLADWAAYYALGLISNSTSYCATTKTGNLHGFWAPFLLLQLGGPATITAFSLDDTSLWVRSGLNLVVQTMAAVIAFLELLSYNNLWIASLFIFFAAMIRYSDRVISLYIASSAKSSLCKSRHPGASRPLDAVEETEQPPSLWGDYASDVDYGKDAHVFFQMYKGLYGDLFYLYSDSDWEESKAYFSGLDASNAFQVMEIELSLAYEVFYTKISLIQRWIERILYPLSTCCVIVAFVLWIVTSKDDYNTIDIVITYFLLVGALVVDIFSAFVILLSDWMINYLVNSDRARYFIHLSKALIALRKRRWVSRKRSGGMKQAYFWSSMVSTLFFPHWSESILQISIVDYCLNRHSKTYEKILMTYYNIIGYPMDSTVSQVEFTAELRDFIFKEIQERGESELALGKADKLCSGKAKWILSKYYDHRSTTGSSRASNPFSDAFHCLEYDERLLVLHVATELLFRANVPHNAVRPKSKPDSEWREISKVLSNYMFYLLVLQQKMVFVPGCLWETLFPETCAEFKRTAIDSKLDKSSPLKGLDAQDSERFMEHGRKSANKVISRGCTLATNLMHYEERRWEVLSKVWMEIACHAAVHSRGSAHGAQLSRGGELFTFIWLMLAHFKIGKQLMYQEKDDDDDDDVDHPNVGRTAVPESASTGGEDNWIFETS
ncbi:hypothetical protein V2J09_003836 [Rumex salicifolius]